ncbi:uncharacterized protein LOC118431053 isoform X2 [Branchiostoma floridae]|uniref:Uncharacterized protein LOC118431053 isoform X2 n=1 Tax=Branchiostoma floridae TaxID=7739 RepID=A0A9J7NCP0_BRAFL|nr:uncharacterized protein LOC118431053 isoform X2 [Branchiostoma floridae]
MTTIAASLVVCFLVALSQTASLEPPQQSPTWPPTFSVGFQEEQHVSVIPLSRNAGAWYYDFANRRARFDHSHGQYDSFCQRVGLSPKDKHGDCQLFFSSLGMHVHYPREQICCRACGAEEGCTVLMPTWLTGATYMGTETIGGLTCQGWVKPGAVATDRWYQTADGKPCQYWEKVTAFVPHVIHVITFNVSSYQLGPIPASVFDVPKYCNVTCPKPYHPPHGVQGSP